MNTYIIPLSGPLGTDWPWETAVTCNFGDDDETDYFLGWSQTEWLLLTEEVRSNIIKSCTIVSVHGARDENTGVLDIIGMKPISVHWD